MLWINGARGHALIVIQRQVGHSNLDINSICLQASTTPKSFTPSTLAALLGPGQRIAPA
jgi:hypothetical protein